MLYVHVSHLYNFPFSTKNIESLKVGLGVLVLGEGEQTGEWVSEWVSTLKASSLFKSSPLSCIFEDYFSRCFLLSFIGCLVFFVIVEARYLSWHKWFHIWYGHLKYLKIYKTKLPGTLVTWEKRKETISSNKGLLQERVITVYIPHLFYLWMKYKSRQLKLF